MNNMRKNLRVTEEMLKNIKGHENRKPYENPFSLQSEKISDEDGGILKEKIKNMENIATNED